MMHGHRGIVAMHQRLTLNTSDKSLDTFAEFEPDSRLS